MKVVTFNLRCDVRADGINAFRHRRGVILDALAREKPDILCMQECLPHMYAFLTEHLAEYQLVGCGRGAAYDSEHNPIAYRCDRFELIALDVNWLSPTPYTPGSRYPEQSSCPRIVTRAILRPLNGGQPFHVFNTHLDHISESARLLGAKQILSLMRAQAETRPFPMLLTGDMNAFPDEACIRAFAGDDILRLTEHTENILSSYHGFGKVTQPRIDYIFSRGFRAEAPARAWHDVSDGIYLSDHDPLCVELEEGGAL